MTYFPIRNSVDFSRAVRTGETIETVCLDFKREFNCKKESWQEEYALDIAQFANTWGGVLLFGICEAKVSSSGPKTASLIAGVSDAEEIKKRINNNVRNLIYPDDLNIEINTFEINEKTIVAANIPPLESGCAFVRSCKKSDSFRIPFRVEIDRRFMQPFQIEERMSDKTRNIQIKMQRLCSVNREIKLISPVMLIFHQKHRVGDLRKSEKTETVIRQCSLLKNSAPFRVAEMHSSEFLLVIGSKTVNIPYSFVKEVWDIGYNETGMALSCSLLVPKFDAPIQIVFPENMKNSI